MDPFVFRDVPRGILCCEIIVIAVIIVSYYFLHHFTLIFYVPLLPNRSKRHNLSYFVNKPYFSYLTAIVQAAMDGTFDGKWMEFYSKRFIFSLGYYYLMVRWIRLQGISEQKVKYLEEVSASEETAIMDGITDNFK